MDIQEELLMDQIERVADSLLGKKIMGERKPKSVEEFRRIVPLTTYEDYEPYLSEQQEGALAEIPDIWCHSAGRGGHFKWIPFNSPYLEKLAKNCVTTLILALCKQKGQVNISPGFRFLQLMAPVPYSSGWLLKTLFQHLSFQAIPPMEISEEMPFQDRIQAGFRLALKDGVDIIAAMASILARMGEGMSEQAQGMKFSPSMLHPKIAMRLARAVLRSKKEKRPILPKDLWQPRAIVTGGVDMSIYRNDIARYWGCTPYELYACTEAFLLAVEGWNRKGMVFFPDLAFLEFIPYGEQPKYREVEKSPPHTVLLNELEKEKLYEVVITHFYGLPLLRYRMNDIVKVIALEDEEAGVKLPHIVFHCRLGETIDLGGLADLDEKTIWQAIANTGLKYIDWAACKEYNQNQTLLRLYLELKEKKEAADVENMIDKQIKLIDTDYKDIDSYLGLQPVRVTLLSPGTFQRYTEEKVEEGVDPAHLKPAHMNASERVIQRLLQLSRMNKE
jgi:phenylacetate-coenzyme A ligase PaaK-like adenylate-forming protein